MLSNRFPRVTGIAVASGLLFTACGDDESAGDVEAFCAEFADSDSVDLDEDFEAGIAEMERIRDLAPSSVRGDVDVLLDTFREVEALDAGQESADLGEDSFEEMEEAFAEMMAIMFDPEVLEATENLETFAVEECGIDPEDLEDDGSISVTDLDESTSSDADGSAETDDAAGDEPVGPMVSEAADGVPDPLFDPFFDDEVDLGVASYEGAQYYLDVNYTDAPWRTRLGSWTFFGVAPPTLEVGGVDLTDAEATEVCAALTEYLVEFDPAGTVTISTYGQNDDGTFGEQTEVVSATAADGC